MIIFNFVEDMRDTGSRVASLYQTRNKTDLYKTSP